MTSVVARAAAVIKENLKATFPLFKAGPGEKVIEYWDGRFPFSKIESGGVLKGYGVSCGRHQNSNGLVPHTPCKKAMHFPAGGSISQDEASLGLKRWLIGPMSENS